MYQKDALVMARYDSAGSFTYGTHSKRQTTRVWLAVARDKKVRFNLVPRVRLCVHGGVKVMLSMSTELCGER